MVDPQDRPSILIVDDNADILAAYAEILKRYGFETATAPDGNTALELAFRLRPDVVLIDLWMPTMDGFAVARALKADERTKKTPLIAFTSLGYTERKAQDAGCDAFVRKGGEPEQLLSVVERFVRR
jgi:two-component system, cell cycle response regulator DivK